MGRPKAYGGIKQVLDLPFPPAGITTVVDELISELLFLPDRPLSINAGLGRRLIETISFLDPFNLLLGLAMHDPHFGTQTREVGFEEQRNHQNHSGFVVEPYECFIKALTDIGMNELLEPSEFVRCVEHD